MANDTSKKTARREAREAVFTLLFETEYHAEDTAAVILERAAAEREFDAADPYIKKTYLGVLKHQAEIDALITRCAKGWSMNRISRVARAVLRLGIYEVVFNDKIPAPVAINEAVELFKKFDDPESKTKSFVNGVLNSVKDLCADGLPADLLPAAPAETPAEAAPAEAAPAEAAPAEAAPAEETPAEAAPAEETPAEETPAEAAHAADPEN